MRLRRQRVILAVGLLAAGCAESGPPPPAPEQWDGIERLVRDLIETRLDAVRRDRRDADAWAALGMSYHANDLVDLAAPCYERAIELDADAARTWFHLARIRSELGDVAGALQAIERVIDLEPSAAHAHWRRGFWLVDEGRLDEAAEVFAHAATLDPSDPTPRIGAARVAILQDRPAAAVATLAPIVERNAPIANGVWIRNQLALAYRQLGDEERAAPLLARQPVRSVSWPDPWSDEVVQRYRRLEEWIVVQAGAMIRQGRPGAALQHLEQLLPDRADDPILLKMQGMAYFALGDMPPAVAALQRVAERYPDDFSVLLNLGHALEKTQQWALALEWTARATALQPENLDALQQQGRILVMTGNHDASRVILERVAERDPRRPDLFIWLTLARIGTGDVEAAAESLQWARQLQPDHPSLPELERQLARFAGDVRAVQP